MQAEQEEVCSSCLRLGASQAGLLRSACLVTHFRRRTHTQLAVLAVLLTVAPVLTPLGTSCSMDPKFLRNQRYAQKHNKPAEQK